MRVAVVTSYFPSSAEPAQGRFAYETLRVLARSAEVEVFYPNAAYPSFLKPRGHLYKKLDLDFRTPDVSVNYFNYPALPLVSRPLNGWAAARALLPYVRSFAPDILLSYFLYPEGDAAVRIGRQLRVPVVVTSIGSDINRIQDSISARHTRAVLRKADFLITVSDDLLRKALTMGASPDKSRVLLNGCDLAVFRVRDRAEERRKLGIDADAEAVVYVGRLDRQKGLLELVEAAASLHPSRPNLHVYLVGAGPDRNLLESAIQKNNATGYIHPLPACAFAEVAQWMSAADVVTLPSYMEGSPNVVREALACGRPVVATRVGGIPEIMNDASGRLVPPRDAAALATALAEVLDGTWNATSISAQWSRSWETAASELQSTLKSVVNKSSPAVRR